jgi:hypothetical protein
VGGEGDSLVVGGRTQRKKVTNVRVNKYVLFKSGKRVSKNGEVLTRIGLTKIDLLVRSKPPYAVTGRVLVERTPLVCRLPRVWQRRL